MGKIRVLIVDDSVVVRRVVAEELSADPEIEVAGAAANGLIAIAKMTQVCPDLVTLDVEMPEMDGLTALAQIRKTHPKVPVIMFSALTERGAAATLDALALGASDYFTKPTGACGPDESRQLIRTELIPAIKALCKDKLAPKLLPQSVGPTTLPTSRTSAGRVDVVAVGLSTGGPNALAEMFRVLPADFPVPLLIVQHMPPTFTRLLAERLTATSRLPAEEATSGAVLRPGRALIAPGDYHMIVARDGTQVRAILHRDPAENSCRPAVDPLFRSIAKVYGPNCLAVVLTGMGQDGLRGCEEIHAAGGQVIVQDEASSVVWGMPGFVARAGLADKVLPLAMIGGEIVRRVGASRGGAT
jgi:two-component system chemotaxis response regulator CheB